MGENVITPNNYFLPKQRYGPFGRDKNQVQKDHGGGGHSSSKNV
jgi:hypothetical protein